MYKPSVGITPEGIPSIGLCALSTITFSLLDAWPLALIFLALTFFSCHFFRDPERVTPQEKDIAISPADGKIIKIAPMTDPVTGEQRQCVSIFMNVFSVHINRSPVAATVTDIIYHPGEFVNAALDKASHDNERCSYGLLDEEGNKWTMVQISGLIARRIVCGVTIGTALQRGERYGMIKFGSRVDIFLPSNYTPSVFIGENVFAGQTVIAHKA